MTPEQRLEELGLEPTAELQLPPGFSVPLVMVKQSGNMLYVSGHGPLHTDGSIAQELLGKVGTDLTPEQGVEAARMTALAMLGTLKRELGELSRIKSWVKVLGMVNSAPDFAGQTPVINAFSELIIDVFGEECGTAARSAVGMASLPMNIPVEVEAVIEVE
jgi:enamine deaminase RidA (YjgF/YER057c/UK114 family)